MRVRRVRDEERGAAAVEFALISLVLFPLLFGIIQGSILFWGYQVGSHAAREAARFAAVEPCPESAVAQRALDRLDDGAPVASVTTPTVTSEADPDPLKVGDSITVTVTYEVIDFGLIPSLPTTLTKSATSRVENLPAGGCSP